MRSNQKAVHAAVKEATSESNQKQGNSKKLVNAQSTESQPDRPKLRAARWIAGLAFAGALALAAPNQAQAQVAFGVQVGGYQGYAAPAYGYGYANPYAVQGWERRRAYDEHARWEAERAAQWQREHWDLERRDRFRGGYGGDEHYWDRGDHGHRW
jgi:hypothetical protein